MDIMYLKYTKNEKTAIVKSGNIIFKNSSIIDSNKKPTSNSVKSPNDTNKIIDLCSILKSKNKASCSNIIKRNKNNIDLEITNFFFEAIHKNHLLYHKDK